MALFVLIDGQSSLSAECYTGKNKQTTLTKSKGASTFESVNKIQKFTIQIKAIEQYVPQCGAVYYAVQGGSEAAFTR